MKKPISTYRLQLSPEFTFEDLNTILDYLDQFGVSTIYAAPFFQARQGSTHGYDVIDPYTINREIGKLEDFQAIRNRMREKNMTWLQDIVPNHMAFDSGNRYLKDIFELGPDSEYYNFFDINWEYKGWEKVMAPFLGAPLEQVLENSQLQLKFDAEGFSLNYYDNKYPLSARSYAKVISEIGVDTWSQKFEDNNKDEEAWRDLKSAFYNETEGDEDLKSNVTRGLKEISESNDKLKEILDLQYYIPTYWKQTEKEINYRRFFTINDLICLSMEDQQVFNSYHYFIKELCDGGLINGLRIDHIDGLFDPEGYLQKLRSLVGEDFYIIVEKILETEEKLPGHWPVEGTSGYEFLAQVNHLLTEAANKDLFQENYERIYAGLPEYEDLVYDKKLFILKERMAGELQNLWGMMQENKLLPAKEKEKEKAYKKALGAFLAAFPVYRIYPQNFPLTPLQLRLIENAYQKALEKQPDAKEELHQLKAIFTGDTEGDLKKALFFLQRCQQFSGPLAAKGVEDTSFYIYNRLISHNEVGDSPENFGVTVREFHERMGRRNKNFPLAINASATHDTKRGEDARMRLNVLSEIPEEWFQKISEWRSINKSIRKDNNVPDANEEYFIYQVILAAMPYEEGENFLSRTTNSLQKALREAKEHTNWGNPDEEYEQEVFQFVKDILEYKKFRESFDPFFKKIAGYGAIKSLSQNLIKITAPGVPDIYQGTELWDLSYVDPDNRRPVDYEIRKSYLSDFKSYNTDNLKDHLKELREQFTSGKIKMYGMYTALRERRNEPLIFLEGDYLPVELSGEQSGNFISYARRSGENWILVVVPVLVTKIFDPEILSSDEEVLEQIKLALPAEAPENWVNVLSGDTLQINGKISLRKILNQFPVGLLKNKH